MGLRPPASYIFYLLNKNTQNSDFSPLPKKLAPENRSNTFFDGGMFGLKNHGTLLNDLGHHPSETTNYKKNIANLRCSLRTFDLLSLIGFEM